MYTKKQIKKWPWDELAGVFNTHLDETAIHQDAAVNIHIGWPVFLEQVDIQSKFLDKSKLDILDFGCGAGSLCEQLFVRGHNVTGIDKSKKMLEKASEEISPEINLILGDILDSQIQTKLENQFDMIVSMHVLDWIKDVKKYIEALSKTVRKEGLLLFSVFPEGHVIDSLIIQDTFEEFDSSMKPKRGYANFDGVKIPVYVKTAKYYDKLFKELKYEKVLEYYPPYPKAFLDNYQWKHSLYPEMLILGYRKST